MSNCWIQSTRRSQFSIELLLPHTRRPFIVWCDVDWMDCFFFLRALGCFVGGGRQRCGGAAPQWHNLSFSSWQSCRQCVCVCVRALETWIKYYNYFFPNYIYFTSRIFTGKTFHFWVYKHLFGPQNPWIRINA